MRAVRYPLRAAPVVSASNRLAIAMMIETDGPGGAEILVLQLSEELRRRGHVVHPIGPEKGKGWLSGKLEAQGFDRKTFSLRRPVDGRMLWDLTRTLRKLRVDAVHSHEFTMAVYGCAAARWLRVPHVITMHGDQGGDSRMAAPRGPPLVLSQQRGGCFSFRYHRPLHGDEVRTSQSHDGHPERNPQPPGSARALPSRDRHRGRGATDPCRGKPAAQQRDIACS